MRRHLRMATIGFGRAVLVASLASALSGCADRKVESTSLPRLSVLPGSLTVSGISAGGYMAGQFHVAHSAAVSGAAILAAGPYFCAEGSMTLGLGRCLSGDPAIPVDRLVGITRELGAAARIDPIADLRADRVWLFRGAQDSVVGAPVVDALEAYYRAFVEPGNLERAALATAAHTFPTQDAGGPCGSMEPPFVGACGYDAAGALLAHLYGELQPRGVAGNGVLVEFDQRVYAKNAGSRGMADSGWVYVPNTCADGRACRLHVVFHGCKQGASFVGDQFATRAGYLEWASGNDIVLLFPQIEPGLQPLNPNGCWDWWGYEGEDYATREGPQIAAVWRMITDLGLPPAG